MDIDDKLPCHIFIQWIARYDLLGTYLEEVNKIEEAEFMLKLCGRTYPNLHPDRFILAIRPWAATALGHVYWSHIHNRWKSHRRIHLT